MPTNETIKFLRPPRVTCRLTLASSIAKDEESNILRTFTAPCRLGESTNEDDDESSTKFQRATGVLRNERHHATNFNIMKFLATLDTETLTNEQAEAIVYPVNAFLLDYSVVLDAMVKKLPHLVLEISWNDPKDHPEWENDLRFYGQWWISLVPACQRAKAPAGVSEASLVSSKLLTDALKPLHQSSVENVYTPLLQFDTTETKNQIIADLAERLGGKTGLVDVFHISGTTLTPDRLHVLFFEGFPNNLRKHGASRSVEPLRETLSTPSVLSSLGDPLPSSLAVPVPSRSEGSFKTLSFPCCSITTAGLLILMTGICYLKRQYQCFTHSLDLSYNHLNIDSLTCLMQILPRTRIIRLALRGNEISSNDAVAFREFLLIGCGPHIEELDLSYTALSAVQLSILMDCILLMKRLRILLLNGLHISLGACPALVRAVQRSNLWHVSLNGCMSGVLVSYAKRIQEIVAENRRRDGLDNNDRRSTSAVQASSFFEMFFSLSQMKSCLALLPTVTLPPSYGAFKSNDPSLLHAPPVKRRYDDDNFVDTKDRF